MTDTWIIQIVQFPCKFFLYQMFISCVKLIQSNWILVSMIKENRETDVTSARLKGTEKLVWFLQMLQNWIWISNILNIFKMSKILNLIKMCSISNLFEMSNILNLFEMSSSASVWNQRSPLIQSHRFMNTCPEIA